jgi:tellurite resistance-related uncharacterized protein
VTPQPDLPEGLELVRTTDVFDNETVPAGLLRAHQVAKDVWGRLVVFEGSIGFVFEDSPDDLISVRAGERMVIPPQRRHHVTVDGPVSFAVEFHRRPSSAGAP